MHIYSYYYDSNKIHIITSTIKAANYGVATKASFTKNEVACTYEGELVKNNSANKKKHLHNYYLYEIDEDWLLDGTSVAHFNNPKLATSKGQFINDPIDDQLVNFKIKIPHFKKGEIPSNRLLVVCALDKVAKNKEMFISYGAQYWMRPTTWTLLSEQHKDHFRLNYITDWNVNKKKYNLE